MARTRKRSRELSNSGSTSNFKEEVSKAKEVAQRSLRGRVVKVTAIPKKQKRGRPPTVRAPVVSENAKNRTYSLSPLQCDIKLENSIGILKSPVASSTCLIDETITFTDSTTDDENVEPGTKIKEETSMIAQKSLSRLSFADRARIFSPVVRLTPIDAEPLNKRTLRSGILKKPFSLVNDPATPQNIAKRRRLHSKAESPTVAKEIKKTTFGPSNTPTIQNNAKTQVMKTFTKDSANKLKKSAVLVLNNSPNTSSVNRPRRFAIAKGASAKDAINRAKKSITFDLDVTPTNMEHSAKAPVVKTPFVRDSEIKLTKSATLGQNNIRNASSVGSPVVKAAKDAAVNKVKKSITFNLNVTPSQNNTENSVKEPVIKTPFAKDPIVKSKRTAAHKLNEAASVSKVEPKEAETQNIIRKDSTFETKTINQDKQEGDILSKSDIPSKMKKESTFEINTTNPNILQKKIQSKSNTPRKVRKDSTFEIKETNQNKQEGNIEIKSDTPSKLQKDSTFEIKEPNQNKQQQGNIEIKSDTPSKLQKDSTFEIKETNQNTQQGNIQIKSDTPSKLQKDSMLEINTKENDQEDSVQIKVETPKKIKKDSTFEIIATNETTQQGNIQSKAETQNILQKDSTFETNTTNQSMQQGNIQSKTETQNVLKDSTFEINTTNQNIESKAGTPAKVALPKTNLIADSETLRLKMEISKGRKILIQNQSSKTPLPKTPIAKGRFTPKPQEGTGQKSECKSIVRTKLPNFAEMHKKNFDRMESVCDHAQRKADRANELMNGRKLDSVNTDTRGANRVYNRFGFKCTKLTDIRRSLEVQEIKSQLPEIISRQNQHIQMAKKTVVKPPEFSSYKRRSILKGVRLNKRFDLQMKYRDCN